MVCRIKSIDYKDGKANIVIEGTEGDTKVMIEKIRKLEVDGTEKRKSLSDEIVFSQDLPIGSSVILAGNVEFKIKEFIDWMNAYPHTVLERTNKAKELFGERLT